METNTPVVIEGLSADWEAAEQWSMEWFITDPKVAQEPVQVFLTKQYDGATMDCTMSQYVQSFGELKRNAAQSGEDVPYLRSWEIGQLRQEMLEGCKGGFEYFKDMFKLMPAGSMVKPPFSWLFIGPGGSYTGVHADAVSSKLFEGGVLTVDAWTTVIRGRKLFRLWPPEALEHLYVGKISGRYGSREFVDMTNPEMDRFPRCTEHSPIEITVTEGQVIYIPKNWAHDVLALEDTISLTTHWLTRANLRAVMSKAKAAKAAAQQESSAMMQRIRALKEAKAKQKAEEER
eukprot:TRINITY_DN18164_c0_g1_i2.p1 TRINITY_DN18164_c0_g1~~TRINITY_DN18164_c0_g1_i2.p1  ORF type:complete len:289 (+),score=79.70 TRINITY_DN18164_c0_g1_i2:193-1059(+)